MNKQLNTPNLRGNSKVMSSRSLSFEPNSLSPLDAKSKFEKPTIDHLHLKNHVLQKIAGWVPLNINKEYLAVLELEKTLLAKQPVSINEIKSLIEQSRSNECFSKETMANLKEKLFDAINNIDNKLFDENIADEYIFDMLYRDLWNLTDDETMQNKQFKDKMLIFQCYLNPENLGIDQARSNFAVHQLAIKGYIIRIN